MITQVAVQDLTKLSVDAIVELVTIDASAPNIGAGVLRYCNQTGPVELSGTVSFQGVVYLPFPIAIEGIEMTAKDASVRPTLILSNVFGQIGALTVMYQDLVGAVVTIRRVLAKYLDGMPGANMSNGLPTDVYKIERKVSADHLSIKFELGNDIDVDDVMIPNAKCNASHCAVQYRSAECGYTGPSKADRYGNALTPLVDRGAWALGSNYSVGDEAYVLVEGVRYYGVCKTAHSNSLTFFDFSLWDHDQCSKRLSTGCSLRFTNADGFPMLAFLGMTRLPI